MGKYHLAWASLRLLRRAPINPKFSRLGILWKLLRMAMCWYFAGRDLSKIHGRVCASGVADAQRRATCLLYIASTMRREPSGAHFFFVCSSQSVIRKRSHEHPLGSICLLCMWRGIKVVQIMLLIVGTTFLFEQDNELF